MRGGGGGGERDKIEERESEDAERLANEESLRKRETRKRGEL